MNLTDVLPFANGQRKRPLVPAALGNRGPNSVKGTAQRRQNAPRNDVIGHPQHLESCFVRAAMRVTHVLEPAFTSAPKEKDRRGQRSKLQSSKL